MTDETKKLHVDNIFSSISLEILFYVKTGDRKILLNDTSCTSVVFLRHYNSMIS